MRKIVRIAAYHEDAGLGADDAVHEAQSGQEPPGETEQTEQPAAVQSQASQEDLLGVVRTVFAEQMEGLKERVQGMIDASLEPLKESFHTLETRQARFSGAGALPGSSGGADGDEDGGQGKALSWVNYGSKPRTAESGSASHQ